MELQSVFGTAGNKLKKMAEFMRQIALNITENHQKLPEFADEDNICWSEKKQM